MIFVIKKSSWLLQGQFGNLKLAKDWIAQSTYKEEDFYITQDLNMKYISRIIYVDGECIYNNKDFWTILAPVLLDEYDKHTVLDFMGQPVDAYRYEVELNTNITRLTAIDGIAGEIDYNMTVGNELIALLREECVKTDLEEVTPLQIAAKTAQIIPMLQTGSFREAGQLIDTLEPDEFFTVERLAKYKDMLAAADVIKYAA
jgi:hypothetical protein